jgi:4-hydroxy-2-oxoheptanedioate aldolase
MTGKEIKSALKQGKNVYGTLVVSTSPKWLKYIKNTGIDFVFIDTEHVAIGRETLSWMCWAYGALGMAPVVRIPSPDPYLATAVLDGGACGILAPYIETAEQVKALAGAVKYKPVKGKKLADKLEGKADFEPALAAYIDKANSDNILLINIESTAGIEALDDLLAVPGLDGVVIGPHDLSCSLGVPENYDHPLFEEAVRGILKKCRDRELGAGIHFMGGADKEIGWAREAGLNLFIHSGDLHLFTGVLKRDLERIKDALGEDGRYSGRPGDR